MSEIDVRPDERFDAIVARLMSRSNGTYDRMFMLDLVARISAEFDGASVHDYLDVLVTKEATDELRRLNGLTTIAA